MKTLWRMNAAGHIPSAVRCSMGPLLAAHGRASNRSSWSVQAGLDHPCVQHACSMVAAITASQGVPVSLGGRSISARRWTLSSVWNRLARPFTIRRSSVAAGHPSRTPSISSSRGPFPVVISLARTVGPVVSRVNSPPALAPIASYSAPEWPRSRRCSRRTARPPSGFSPSASAPAVFRSPAPGSASWTMGRP